MILNLFLFILISVITVLPQDMYGGILFVTRLKVWNTWWSIAVLANFQCPAISIFSWVVFCLWLIVHVCRTWLSRWCQSWYDHYSWWFQGMRRTHQQLRPSPVVRSLHSVRDSIIHIYQLIVSCSTKSVRLSSAHLASAYINQSWILVIPSIESSHLFPVAHGNSATCWDEMLCFFQWICFIWPLDF